MDRSVIVVGVVVAAAVGLFAVNLVRERSSSDDELPGFASRRPANAGTVGSDAVAHESRDPATGRPSGGPRSGRSARTADEPGAAGESAAAARGTAALSEGRRAAVKSLGTSSAGSRGAGGGPGTSVGLASAPGASGGSGGSGRGPLGRDRSEFLEKIAALPTPARAAPPVEPVEGEPGDVVLAVEHAAQAEQSSSAADGVEAAKDGVGIDFNDNAVLAFPDAGNAKGDAGSITFDINPSWEGGSRENHALVGIDSRTEDNKLNDWANRIELVKNERYLRYLVIDSTGVERDISIAIDGWQPGERHSVTATWGNSTTSLYVDGHLVGQRQYPGALEFPPGAQLYLGSKAGVYQGAGGTIQNFKVYGRALDQADLR